MKNDFFYWANDFTDWKVSRNERSVRKRTIYMENKLWLWEGTISNNWKKERNERTKWKKSNVNVSTEGFFLLSGFHLLKLKSCAFNTYLASLVVWFNQRNVKIVKQIGPIFVVRSHMIRGKGICWIFEFD